MVHPSCGGRGRGIPVPPSCALGKTPGPLPTSSHLVLMSSPTGGSPGPCAQYTSRSHPCSKRSVLCPGPPASGRDATLWLALGKRTFPCGCRGSSPAFSLSIGGLHYTNLFIYCLWEGEDSREAAWRAGSLEPAWGQSWDVCLLSPLAPSSVPLLPPLPSIGIVVNLGSLLFFGQNEPHMATAQLQPDPHGPLHACSSSRDGMDTGGEQEGAG